MKRAWLVLLLCGCEGVLYTRGNDFRCVFADGPQKRDEACSQGDVCGTDDRCHRYVYEGPRFEGPATLPTFKSPTTLHPRVLTDGVASLAQSGLNNAFAKANLTYVQTDEREVFAASPAGTLVKLGVLPPMTGRLLSVFQFEVPNSPVLALAASGMTSAPRDQDLVQPRLFSLDGGEFPIAPARRFHPTADLPVGGGGRQAPDALLVSPDGLSVQRLTIGFNPMMLPRVSISAETLPSGPVFDVGFASRSDVYSGEVAIGPRDFLLHLDGGLVGVGAEGVDFNASSRLKQTPTGDVIAVVTTRDGGDVLSTWHFVRSAGSTSVERQWSDCSPCGGGIEDFAPLASTSGVAVDVVCDKNSQLRVTGSSVSDPTRRCTQVSVDFNLNPAQLNALPGGVLARDRSALTGLSLGGRKGQLWRGDSVPGLASLFLDRVPVDVSAITKGGVLFDVALTDSYVASRTKENGFVRLALQGTADTGRFVAPIALVHQAPWVVTQEGDLRRIDVEALLTGNTTGVLFGPRLVDGRGAPITRALWGEALNPADGGEPISMLIAADDSLYFVTNDQLSSRTPNAEKLTAQLTPEPGTAIRHLALERTPLGSNGVDRMRAYVVTSRNAYEVTLGASPPRWSAKPLVVFGGEPAEVWLDNPRGGLGRIGYRTGEVFTLPGGFELVEALQVDAGVAARVLDFENLGGWPVALATTGLYVAQWDTLPSGALNNRFADGGINKPMSWVEVSLPDGGKPWLTRTPKGPQVTAGALSVRTEPQEVVTVDGGATTYSTMHRLYVFLPDNVIEVGQHVRTNKTSAPSN